MKRKQRSIAPISDQQATTRRLTRRHFLGTGLVAGIGAAVLTPRIAMSLQTRKAKALIGQPQAGFYKGICYQAFPAPYDPSTANTTCIFFGSDVAYNPMAPLWGIDYQSRSGMRFRGRNDLQKMQDMGVNLVRLYDWEPRNLHLNFLDYCERLGIKVLAPVSNYFLTLGHGDPTRGGFEMRETLIPALIRSYTNAAGTDYHPAIAGIIMGNEPHIGNKFGVTEEVQFTQDWVRIEEAQFRNFRTPLIGHPVDFGKYGNDRYPQWTFFGLLLEGLMRTSTRDLQNRLFLAPQPQNDAEYLFDNAEGAGKGYVQLTYEKFNKPQIFTEIGKDRTQPNYLNIVDEQLRRSIEYGTQHPEQLPGICHFQFSDKVWKCPTSQCSDSEGSFGVFSHTHNVRETVNYVPEDFTHFDVGPCTNQQLLPDDLTQNPTYGKIVANYGGRDR